jgi:hypothetical protein
MNFNFLAVFFLATWHWEPADRSPAWRQLRAASFCWSFQFSQLILFFLQLFAFLISFLLSFYFYFKSTNFPSICISLSITRCHQKHGFFFGLLFFYSKWFLTRFYDFRINNFSLALLNFEFCKITKSFFVYPHLYPNCTEADKLLFFFFSCEKFSLLSRLYFKFQLTDWWSFFDVSSSLCCVRSASESVCATKIGITRERDGNKKSRE